MASPTRKGPQWQRTWELREGSAEVQRGSLPIPDERYEGLITYDARDPASKFAPIEPIMPPAGAPNVLVVLLDDVGFGAGSAFGGPAAMPTAERLAANGLKYTRFHTTALCSPTRAALISGRNHHSVGKGHITENASASPGRTSVRPNYTAPVPEVLRLNGYSTAHFGKCHEVPLWELSPAGPFDRWPSPGNGFQHFSDSWAARPTSGIRCCTATTPRSTSRRCPRTAIT